VESIVRALVGSPRIYADILLGRLPELSNPLLRVALAISLGGLLAGLIWAAGRREWRALWFIVPLLLAHAPWVLFDPQWGPAIEQWGLWALLAHVLLILGSIAVVVWRCGKARGAAGLVGWFCLAYACLQLVVLGVVAGSL
jgi:alpha-beta hydrolase superfamily lysophospholipase